MRRLLLVLGTMALSCMLATVAAGCGGDHATSSRTTTSARLVVLFKGVTLSPSGDAPCEVTFPVSAAKLRMLAEVRGNAPPHGTAPSLDCVLYKLPGASSQGPEAAVLMGAGGHAVKGALWVYHIQTLTQLTPGTYRLSLSGWGRVTYFAVAQL